jgi:hypothetical protein
LPLSNNSSKPSCLPRCPITLTLKSSDEH